MSVLNKFDIFFLILLLYIDKSASVKILKLSVPPVVDLQEPSVILDCKYDMEKEELYSVKWYKDEQEFYRYIPRGVGEQSFNVSAIFVQSKRDKVTFCDSKHCPVILTNLTWNSEGIYKCEISTEAPTFKVFYDTANMTIVALPRGAVKISTPKTEYSEGDDIFVNCTSPAADPPPKIRWYINDHLMKPSSIVLQSDSSPDDRGLVRTSLAARLNATRDLFLQNNNLLALRCEVSVPQQLPLHSTVYMTMYELKQLKFDWLSSQGTRIHVFVYLFLGVFIPFVVIL